MLVNVCFHGMMEVYKIFLERMCFPSSFSKLMEVARHINESVQRTSRASTVVRPNHTIVVLPVPRKRPIVVAINIDRGAKPFNPKRPSFKKIETKGYHVLPPFLYGVKKAMTLLEQWIKDQVIRMPLIDTSPPTVNQKVASYCPYHQRNLSSNA